METNFYIITFATYITDLSGLYRRHFLYHYNIFIQKLYKCFLFICISNKEIEIEEAILFIINRNSYNPIIQGSQHIREIMEIGENIFLFSSQGKIREFNKNASIQGKLREFVCFAQK